MSSVRDGARRRDPALTDPPPSRAADPTQPGRGRIDGAAAGAPAARLAGDCVVLGYDRSEPSRTATEAASLLAVSLEVPLTLVHVRSRPGSSPTGWQSYDAARRVAALATRSAGPRLEIRFVERTGRLGRQLAQAAVEAQATLVVLDGRRSRGARRWLRRSLEQEVVRGAACPVLLVPRGE